MGDKLNVGVHQECPGIEFKANKITITVPNKDDRIGNHMVCPKEVLQKAYMAKKGKTIVFDEELMNVIDVRITDDFIYIELERADNEEEN